ncbi:hypothetical protein ACN4EE_18420 [Geminocystis sp. CENA526]|uniref:hypothetical protein n=1 Tax=Geminocystis sp. CENA526 TaxID=1355871 RepID=UPI003D6EC196
MNYDPVIAELYQIKQDLAAEFDYDLKKIYEALKVRQKANPKPHIKLPAKRSSNF